MGDKWGSPELPLPPSDCGGGSWQERAPSPGLKRTPYGHPAHPYISWTTSMTIPAVTRMGYILVGTGPSHSAKMQHLRVICRNLCKALRSSTGCRIHPQVHKLHWMSHWNTALSSKGFSYPRRPRPLKMPRKTNKKVGLYVKKAAWNELSVSSESCLVVAPQLDCGKTNTDSQTPAVMTGTQPAAASTAASQMNFRGVQVANQSQSFADSDSTRSSRGGTGYRGRARGRFNNRPQCQLCGRVGHVVQKCYYRFDLSFQGRNHDETGLQTGYDGNQRQHGFNSNVGYSKNNVGYSQRTDNPIQAYNHSSGHPGLTLSPMSSGYPFGNSSQVYSSPNYSPSLMVTPTAPHSSTSGSGMSTNLVSSPTTAHFVSPLTASSSAASGSSTFLTQSGSLVASPGAGSSTADAIWYPDSGATHHITNDLSTLHSGTVYKGSDQLLMGNGGGVQICHIGQGSLLTRSKPLFLQKLLHVPTISKNLLSVSQLARENNVYFEFHPYECRVKDSQTRATLLEGSLTPEGLYKLVSPGSSTHQVSPMDNSSYLPLVSPPVVDVSRNRQVLSPVGVPAFVHEDSVVPTGGCGNASSHDSSVQPNVAVDVSVMSGHASEPLIDATHGGVGSPVLAELDTEVHATGHDVVGESCVEATAAVQNGIATSLCDGDLCPVEESEHYEVGDEAATLIPSVSATTEGLCEQHEVGLYVKKAAWNEVKLGEY
ncbi:hypothetical protein GQ457_14G005840 [Hibiscus cannabinus]